MGHSRRTFGSFQSRLPWAKLGPSKLGIGELRFRVLGCWVMGVPGFLGVGF